MPNVQSKPPNANRRRFRRNRKRNPPTPTKAVVSTAKAPVSITVKTRSNAPVVRSTRQGFIVRHREYLQDISSVDSNFRNNALAVNPGVATSFPWLSAIAGRYEFYVFRRLHYVYEPICPTTTPGSVMMAIDYDAADTPPATKTALMSYRSAVRTAPWDRIRFDALRSDLHKFVEQRHIRLADAPTGTDIKTYDVGNLYFATQSTPASPTTLGELYVEYDVVFYTPQLPSTIIANRRNAEQTGVLSIPANGLVNLAATITGDTNQPLFWIHRADSTGVDLILNLTQFADSYINVLTGSAQNIAGGTQRLLQFYDNISPNTNNPRSAFGFSRVGDGSGTSTTSGRYYDTSPGNCVISHLFRQRNVSTPIFGANLLPVRIPRPTGGTLGLNINLQPAHQLPANLFERYFTNTGTDWAFPNVDTPVFSASARSLKLDNTGFTQTFNLQSENDATEIVPVRKGR